MPDVILTGNQVMAFSMLQLYYKLKLEVDHPNGPKWRVSPAKQCRQILINEGRPNPGRSKRQVFEAFGAWLDEQGLLRNHGENHKPGLTP